MTRFSPQSEPMRRGVEVGGPEVPPPPQLLDQPLAFRGGRGEGRAAPQSAPQAWMTWQVLTLSLGETHKEDS